jgi:hypothetical protein
MTNAKQRAHELIDRLPPARLSALILLLEAMLDPVAHAIANAPIDDEPETEREKNKVHDSKAWFESSGGKSISDEEVLSDFGVTLNNFSEGGEREP